jgi:hypothetical protein
MVGTTAASTLTSSDDLTISTSGSTGITLFSATGNAGNIAFGDGTSGDDRQRGLLQYHHSDNTMRFFTNAARRMTITSEGALLLSTAGIRRNTKGSSQYQAFLIEGITNDTTRMSMIRSSNDDNGPEIQIIKTRGTSVGSVTKPNQNDYLGAFVFLAGDDSDLFTRGAEIGVQATGTPANDRCPSDIIFSTTPTSGASTPQERLRISSEGYVTKPNHPAFKCAIMSQASPNSGVVENIISDGHLSFAGVPVA